MSHDICEQRAALIRRIEDLRDETLQIFHDADAWNRLHPSEPPLDPDPDGELAAILERTRRTLAGEIRLVKTRAT